MTKLEKLKKQHMILTGRLEAMQGHVFFIQDDHGCLRRWTPPVAKTLFDGDETSD